MADYKLDRQLKTGEDLGTDRLQALRLDNSQGGATREKEGLFGIPGLSQPFTVLTTV